MTVTAEELALNERVLVSQFTTPTLGLSVRFEGELSDADNNTVVATMVASDNTQIFNREATNVGTGLYEITLSSKETAVVGLYQLYWDYDLSAIEQTHETYIEVGLSAPAYEALDDSFKEVVNRVWNKFADGFDSPLGGPHLQVYMQTSFGRGRMAELLYTAIGELNALAQPHFSYSVDGVSAAMFPVATWGGLLEKLLYIETLKHLRRSYLEQPLINGVNVAYVDRRDYADRWAGILADEKEDVDKMLARFRVSHYGFGSPNVLVAGGAYPNNWGPMVGNLPYSIAARPVYWRGGLP